LFSSRAGANNFAPSIPILFLERLRIFRFAHYPSGFLPMATAKTSEVLAPMKQFDKFIALRGILESNLIKNGQFGSF
jgi:hypothetical protein